MAIPELTVELQKVAHAELLEIKRELRSQKKIAEALGVSAFTVGNAMRKEWASRDVLDGILKYRGNISEGQLLEKHAAALTTATGATRDARSASADDDSDDAMHELTNLTTAVCLVSWDPSIRAAEQLAVVREVAALVASWKLPAAARSVQMWRDMLRTLQFETLAKKRAANDKSEGRARKLPPATPDDERGEQPDDEPGEHAED